MLPYSTNTLAVCNYLVSRLDLLCPSTAVKVAGAHQRSLGGSPGKIPNDDWPRGSGVLGHRESLGLGEQSNGPLKRDRVEMTKDRILTSLVNRD